MRLAPVLFVLGLVLVPTALCGLIGLWWALLAAGLECIVLAVLTDAGTRRAQAADKSRSGTS